jgi:DNA-binding transcriptional LysR family regulator
MGPSDAGAVRGIQQPSRRFANQRLSIEVGAVDLDLARVRAFVAAVDEAHFGRAADALAISQQALSKRIARLEAELGVRLLTRGTRGVAPTEAGRRFLAPARRLLADGELAVAAARREERPVRIDVWGHLFAPMRTVQRVVDHASDIEVEVGFGRDLPAAISALLRGEIDVGFGRVHPTDGLRDGGLAHRLVRFEPVDAVVSRDHVLADRDELRPTDLRGSTLMFPAAAHRLDFLTRFADRFGISDRSTGANLGLEHFVDLLPADVRLPDGSGVRTVPLVDPTPLYAWSLIWRRDDHHPRLPALLEAFADIGRYSRWLDYRPTADWLPPSDQVEADQVEADQVEADRVGAERIV